jgi:adenylate cyclase
VGDGVMALFGAPVTRSDDPQRAVEAALEIRACIDELRPQLLAQGMPAPDIGIGLNTSRVVAGNIGSPSRLNYTVLGDGVNLASRLEGLTKRYLVPIVVGNRTRESVKGIVFRELDKVRVRGKLIAERIWEPLGHEGRVLPAELRNVERWHAALQKYRTRDFRGAIEGFTALASVRGYERLVAIHLAYLRELDARPPAADWDAAYTLFDK